jgi:hypothetical protein
MGISVVSTCSSALTLLGLVYRPIIARFCCLMQSTDSTIKDPSVLKIIFEGC